MAASGETIQKLQAELQQAQEQIEQLTSQLQVCREAANDSEMRWQGERRAFERVIKILNGGRANG